MGINLGRCDVSMTKHRLDAAQIRAVLDEMRRESVPNHVRADPLGRDPRLHTQRLDHLKKPLARDETRFGPK